MGHSRAVLTQGLLGGCSRKLPWLQSSKGWGMSVCKLIMDTVEEPSGPCHLVLFLGLFTPLQLVSPRGSDGGGTLCHYGRVSGLHTLTFLILLVRSESWSLACIHQEGIIQVHECWEARITEATLDSGYNFPSHDTNFVQSSHDSRDSEDLLELFSLYKL